MADLHALVIGVDRHEPSRGIDGGLIPDLTGAVADALRVARYLREGPFEVPAERLRTLISPSRFSDLPWPDRDDLPTYANVVRAVADLERTARRGDQVLIHFSGHGMRVPSALSVKGRDGWDEALVPSDAGSREGGPLRDVEMYRLLSRLSEAGLYVTLLVDACHSGGSLRDAPELDGPSASPAGVRVRGLGRRHGAWGRAGSLCGAWDALYGEHESARPVPAAGRLRHFGGESGWFPQPKGCVLLAACREHERAREAPWGGAGVGGIFTHSLLEGLEILGGRGGRFRYETLLDRVRSRVGAVWSGQTPTLEGDGGLAFLGAGARAEPAPGGAWGPHREPAERREHLALYDRIRDLEPAPDAPLYGALQLDLCRLERREDWTDLHARRPVRLEAVPTGLLLCLLVRNTGERPLNGVVVELRPDGAVERVHPAETESESALLEPGVERPVFLRTWLPDGVREARSLLKVIASVDPIRADRFVLPPLDRAPSPVRAGTAPHPLPAPEEDGWTAADLEVTVVAPVPGTGSARSVQRR